MGTDFEHCLECVVTAFAREDQFFPKKACLDPWRVARSLFLGMAFACGIGGNPRGDPEGAGSGPAQEKCEQAPQRQQERLDRR